MKQTPIDYQIVTKKIQESNLANVGKASIRQLLKLVNEIEQATGQRFIRMEMGIPGLKPASIGVEAEIEALKNGIGTVYSNIEGISDLKREISKFAKLFLNLDINSEYCIPTVGSCMGSFASFMTLGRMYEDKNATLFIDPGFPVHKQQLRTLGQKFEGFDVYHDRGDKLHDKLEGYLSRGHFVSILYSNPNNPAWLCFTEKELKIIGELAQKYNAVVIEDLAYFGMDFREDYSKPGQPPYQPSVAHYCQDYILLISTSKIFSYAGQRIGMLLISDHLFNTRAKNLEKYFTMNTFGQALIFGSLYALSAGTAHSPQYALAALLKAVNSGAYNYREPLLEYGKRARIMKQLFLENGFHIVYDKDEDKPIADGFYFTFSYPGFSGEKLVEELLYYGISAISLSITGSERIEGLRACVAQVDQSKFSELQDRLKKFHRDHPVN